MTSKGACQFKAFYDIRNAANAIESVAQMYSGFAFSDDIACSCLRRKD